MKKLAIPAVLALLLVGANPAQAGDMKGGLGFHIGQSPIAGPLSNISTNDLLDPSQIAATIGGRQWLTGQVGLDFGVGYLQLEATQGSQKNEFNGVSFDIGLPIVIKKLDNVNFIFRPGYQYGTFEDKDATVDPAITTKFTLNGFSAGFEAEWMVAKSLSVSAAHGLTWASLESDGPVTQKFTSLGTTGSNFTQLGFNVYLW